MSALEEKVRMFVASARLCMHAVPKTAELLPYPLRLYRRTLYLRVRSFLRASVRWAYRICFIPSSFESFFFSAAVFPHKICQLKYLPHGWPSQSRAWGLWLVSLNKTTMPEFHPS